MLKFKDLEFKNKIYYFNKFKIEKVEGHAISVGKINTVKNNLVGVTTGNI
jgi:hypothetical protein